MSGLTRLSRLVEDKELPEPETILVDGFGRRL